MYYNALKLYLERERENRRFVKTKFFLSRIDSCEVQSNNTRYIRTYFICIRPEKMARPLMSLADAPRKTFSTSRSSSPLVGFSLGPSRLIWMRRTYLPTPPLRSFQNRSSTSTRRSAHDTTFIPLRIKSRAWVQRETGVAKSVTHESNMIVNLKLRFYSHILSGCCIYIKMLKKFL